MVTVVTVPLASSNARDYTVTKTTKRVKQTLMKQINPILDFQKFIFTKVCQTFIN